MEKKLSGIDNLTLFAIFIAPFKDILIINVGIVAFKLPQMIWSFIFLFLLIKRLENKRIALNINYEERNNNLIFALYICIITISCMFAIDFQRSSKELIQYLYLFFAMYVIYKKSKESYFFEYAIKAVIISNAFLVVIALLSIILGKSIIPTVTIFSSGRIYLDSDLFSSQELLQSGSSIERISILGMGPIGISYYVLMQSLLVNYKIRVTTGKVKIGLIILMFCNAVLIILGYSRIGILLFFIVNILTLFNKNNMKNLGVILFTIIIAYLFLSLFPNVFQRILETFNTEEQSSRYHFVFWLIALKTGYNNILTGIGIGNMEYTPGNNDDLFNSFGLYKTQIVPTHNFILQIWSEQGMVGLLINIILLLAPVVYYVNARFIRKTLSSNSIYNYLVLAYMGICIYTLTNNSYFIEGFWGFLGLMYAMKYNLMMEGKLLMGKYIPASEDMRRVKCRK